MATTTPNFGWPVPTSTDLVKDGATAIEALGDGIDTSMVDLKGGLTGQVLSKTTNADMDFTWVTSDDANAIQNSIVDAKGDLIAASADDTPARLAVGNNGETLVADSSTSTGLRYTAGNPIPNPVINSAMQNWQRGTSFSIAASTAASASTYTADRWQTKTNANQAVTVSRQATGDTTNLPFIQYAYRYQRNSGQTGTGDLDMIQNFESVNSIPFAGKTITYSFYARKGADYSAASSALTARIFTGTGTDQNIYSGYTGTVTTTVVTATLTTSWQRFSGSMTIGATATQIATDFLFVPVGTAGTNDYYEVTGVQIDIGSVALPFRTYAGTIQGETSACQRYYYRMGGDAAFQYFGNGTASSTTVGKIFVKNVVTMRTAPTSIDYSTIGLSDGVAAVTALTALAFDAASKDGQGLTCTVASGLTQYRPYTLFANNSTSAYLGFSAEL